MVKVSCVLPAGCPVAPLVGERRIEDVYQNGPRQIERVRDLKACTYHAVDNDHVRYKILNFSSNVISCSLAIQGWYQAFFPSVLKTNP
jgi:hypothetical protein